MSTRWRRKYSYCCSIHRSGSLISTHTHTCTSNPFSKFATSRWLVEPTSALLLRLQKLSHLAHVQLSMVARHLEKGSNMERLRSLMPRIKLGYENIKCSSARLKEPLDQTFLRDTFFTCPKFQHSKDHKGDL